MKVDVVQVEQATFRHRLKWWSNWIDVAVFDYAGEPWLIQMCVSRTNRKRFRSVNITGCWYANRLTNIDVVGDLVSMAKKQVVNTSDKLKPKPNLVDAIASCFT